MQLLWSSFFKNLAKVNSIHINQHIFSHQTNYRNIVLHGFFDASNEAYVTVVYLQIVYNNETFINLLTAESKILPNKNYQFHASHYYSYFFIIKIGHLNKGQFKT